MAIYAPPGAVAKPFKGVMRTDLGNVQVMSSVVADDFIRTHGVTCEIWEAVPCPCVSSDRQLPVADCVTCHGRGDFHPEDRRIETVALLSGRTVDQKVEPFGVDGNGRINVTCLTGITWREGWLIIPKGEEHVISERVVRSGRLTDTSRIAGLLTDDIAEPIAIENRAERFIYPKVTRIRDVYYGGGSSEVTRCREHFDYELVDGLMTWKPGRGPLPGYVYTVIYTAPAAYLMGDERERRDGDVILPSSCTATRLDVAVESRMRG